MRNNEIIHKLHEKTLYYNFKPALEEQLLDVIPAKMEIILENNILAFKSLYVGYVQVRIWLDSLHF